MTPTVGKCQHVPSHMFFLADVTFFTIAYSRADLPCQNTNSFCVKFINCCLYLKCLIDYYPGPFGITC